MSSKEKRNAALLVILMVFGFGSVASDLMLLHRGEVVDHLLFWEWPRAAEVGLMSAGLFTLGIAAGLQIAAWVLRK